MKDDLFYLCWLLADSEELIDCLLNKDISTYDVTKLSELKKRDILNKACRLVNKKEYEDVLYDLIYKRNCDYCLLYTSGPGPVRPPFGTISDMLDEPFPFSISGN